TVSDLYQEFGDKLEDHNKLARIDRHEFCPIDPDAAGEAQGTARRHDRNRLMPGPGMLLDAAEAMGARPQDCWVIGSADAVGAGSAAGCQTVLITGDDTPAAQLTGQRGRFAAPTTAEAVALIRQQVNPGAGSAQQAKFRERLGKMQADVITPAPVRPKPVPAVTPAPVVPVAPASSNDARPANGNEHKPRFAVEPERDVESEAAPLTMEAIDPLTRMIGQAVSAPRRNGEAASLPAKEHAESSDDASTPNAADEEEPKPVVEHVASSRQVLQRRQDKRKKRGLLARLISGD
ncbi:MAG: HAD hydrolase-like protein, partial [Planctomycetota bacterium]